MKTPKKSQAGDSSAPTTPVGRTYYKRFEVLFISLGSTVREDLVGAPDVGILPVTVPGATLEASRLARHICEGKIVELVSACKFNGIVIDSLLETGVEISREVFDSGPVVGTFVPAVNQALLIGGTFGVVVVNAVDGDFIPQTLRELAVRHHVSDRLVAVQCVPTSALLTREEEVVHQLIDIVLTLGKKHGCSSIILSGGLHIPTINETIRLRGESLVVIDASLAAINAIEGAFLLVCILFSKQRGKRIDSARIESV
jgi:Asp/Glu/hydantoin racemase